MTAGRPSPAGPTTGGAVAQETNFDPVLLRTFLAVARGLSFTRAAEQLGLSQPTVSQHVRRLEEAAKRQLVRRDRLVWVGTERLQLAPEQPVPVITYHAPSLSRSAAIDSLDGAGRTWRITCNTREINGVLAATRAGIGICVLAQSRVPGDLR